MLFLPLLLPAALAQTAPVAEAGLGVFAYVGDRVILNGEASYDPDGLPITYAWTQISGPPTALADATTASPSFQVETPGTVRFQLLVSDGAMSSTPDTVAVVIPDRGMTPLGSEGGCATVPSAPARAAWIGLLAAVLLRRR